MFAFRAYIPGLVAAALLIAAGVPAGAQSVSDFRLPPGSASATPRPQGPVDPDSPPPVAATPSAPPSAAPSPAQSPAARVVVPAAAPAPPRSVALPAPVARGTAIASPAPAPVEAAAPAPTATEFPPATDVPPAPATAAAPQVAAAGEGSVPLWQLVPVGLGFIGLGVFLFRRRRPQPVHQEEALADAESPMVLPELDDLSSAPAPAPAPAEPDWLALEMEPVRFSVSLVNATLQYRLRLTNLLGHDVGPLAIAADMIGAHASLPEDSQLGRDGAGLELRHELALLGAGQTSELKGELRLPLAAVTPIRSGAATLIVPLVRLRVEAPGLTLARAVVVGESPAAPGGLLRPFRLDTGPRIFGEVSQRGIAEAA